MVTIQRSLILRLPLLLVLLVAGPLCPASSAAAPPAFQDDELPDKRPEVKELCETLRDHAKARGEEDREAVAVIDTLIQEFPNSGPKDRAMIVKELSKCLEKPRKETEAGFDNTLFIAVAVALGEMAPESAKTLIGWVDHKKHRKNLELQRRLILSLGRTKDGKGLKTLEGLLQHHQDMLVAAAAEAIGEYSEHKLKERKAAFHEMLKLLMGLKAAVDQDATDVRSRERYDAVAAPIITSLQRLSGHDERSPEKWERWWNKNKKKDWDEAD